MAASQDDAVFEAAPSADPAPVLALVWRAQTLGIAFIEGSVMRFAEVSDTAPDFRVLQSLKYVLKPSAFVVPAGSDVAATGSNP